MPPLMAAPDLPDHGSAASLIGQDDSASQIGLWIFESSPDCVKLLDLRGNLVRMNRNGQCAMDVEDFAAIAGRSWVDLWPVESRDRVRRSIDAALHVGHDQFQAFCPSAKGSPRWWDVRVAAVRDAHGRAVQLLSVSRDVTEVVQAREREQQALLRLNEQLEDQVRRQTHDLHTSTLELESLWYALAHDLRAPLATVHGFARALLEREGPNLAGPSTRLVERIRGGAQRMEDMIQGILSLAQISQNPGPAAPFDLSACARHELQHLASEEPARCVDWAVEDGLVFHGFRAQLRAMVEQLVKNAWKFTALEDAPRIRVSRLRDGQFDGFEVTDNGAGFDMQYAHRLFKPFQRLHRDDEFTGVGIGLTIAWKVAAIHRGGIEVRSAIGKGATFRVWLPHGSSADLTHR